MYKFLSGCVVGIATLASVNGVATEDEVRAALEEAIGDSKDHSRFGGFIAFVSNFNKLGSIDVDNMDELAHRFENWKKTDDRISERLAQQGDYQWELGHTRFSDWSDAEKSSIVLDESFINSESRSAVEASNCKQVSLTDSSLTSSSLTSDTTDITTSSYNIDHRTYDIAGIQDQGTCSSCWDFSDVATLELNRNLDYLMTTDNNDNTDSFVKLSEQYVLDCSDDGIGTCSGGYPIFTLMWMNENSGICASSDYTSYSEEEQTCETSSCDKVDESLFDQLYCLADENDEQASMAASAFSVEFAFKVYSDFYDYTGGVYSCDTSEEFIGWHAVTIVGITQDYYIVKNSWSTDWGIDGYFYMSRDSYDDCKMSHFAFVSFNDLSDAIDNSENTPIMDVSKIADIRSAGVAMTSKNQGLKSVGNDDTPLDHIKIHGKTNENILLIVGVIVGVSLLLCCIGMIYRACRNRKHESRTKLIENANKTNEKSALLDGYVAL